MPDLLVTDADNTLWDTDAVFAEAQLNLLARVEERIRPLRSDRDRLAFVRRIDQEIASSHPDGLRYPISILIEKLVQMVAGDPSAKLGEENAKDLQIRYYSDLQTRPRLRWGVRPALQELSAHNVQIWVVSEGSEKRIRESLEDHGIASFVDRVVSAKKDVAMFAALSREARLFGLKAVVGDQLDRDIAPAKQAGFFTIHLPGSFAPEWVDPEMARFIDKSIGNYREVAETIVSDRGPQKEAMSG